MPLDELSHCRWRIADGGAVALPRELLHPGWSCCIADGGAVSLPMKLLHCLWRSCCIANGGTVHCRWRSCRWSCCIADGAVSLPMKELFYCWWSCCIADGGAVAMSMEELCIANGGLLAAGAVVLPCVYFGCAQRVALSTSTRTNAFRMWTNQKTYSQNMQRVLTAVRKLCYLEHT